MKSKIYENVINFIKKHKLIEKNSKVIIALSGGPDSIFAFYFLNQFKKKYRLEILAAHINHNLRGSESDKDQKFCEKLCKDFDIPLFVKSVDVKSFAKKQKISIEEAARNIRYNFFDEVLESQNADLLITAHNSDDNSETILLNLIKGTGLNGLSGIPVKREKIVRPFLCLSKKEILDFLKTNKIKFRIDKSNEENDFERNKIRNKIIPQISELNPSLNKTLRNFADNIFEINQFIKQEVEKYSENYIEINENEIQIDENLFSKPNVSISSLVIKKLFDEELQIGFTSNDADEIKNLSKLQKGSELKLRNNFQAVKESKSLLIKKKSLENFSEIELKLEELITTPEYEILLHRLKPDEDHSKFSEIISGDKIDDIFILRRWNYGDKFIPLGMRNFKKISDFLTDSKIKSTCKKKHLILTNRNEIVYVFGLRIDERYKVTDSTKNRIGIWLKKTK